MYYRKCSLLTAIPRLPHIATICRSAAFIGFNYLGSCNLYMSNGRRQQRSAFICHFLGGNWLILGDGCSNIFLSLFSSSAILLATVLTTTCLASIVLNSAGIHTKLYSDFKWCSVRSVGPMWTLLNQTPIFEWYMARLVAKNVDSKNTSWRIGLCSKI